MLKGVIDYIKKFTIGTLIFYPVCFILSTLIRYPILGISVVCLLLLCSKRIREALNTILGAAGVGTLYILGLIAANIPRIILLIILL